MLQPTPPSNQTQCCNSPQLTYLNYIIWEETITIVQEALHAKDIVTGEEPELYQIDTHCHEWKFKATNAETIMHLSCSPAIQILLRGLISPVTMWTRLKEQLHNTCIHIGRTTVQHKF